MPQLILQLIPKLILSPPASNKPMKVEKVACQTHVTALHYHRDKLFVGAGQDLEVYSLATPDQAVKPAAQPASSIRSPTKPGEPLKLRVFDCFSIQGINVHETEDGHLFVLVHGNRFCSLYEFIESQCEQSEEQVEPSRAIEQLKIDQTEPIKSSEQIQPPADRQQTEQTDRWRLMKNQINFCDWILEVQLKDGRIYALLTSNKLGVFDLQTNQRQIIACPEKFTLYAAKFLDESADNQTTESSDHGRVQITVAAGTVFSEILICNYHGTDCTITERLTGHDGSLFSIDYRPDLQLLASASDDRTVRLWSRASGRFVCTQVLYGHEARIWQVKLTSRCIVSIGEISSLFFWSYEGARCLFKERSKKISYWKLAVDETNQRLFYGASDGSIKQRSIEDAIGDETQLELSTANPKWFQFFQRSPADPLHLLVTQPDGHVKVWAIGDGQVPDEQPVAEFDFGRAFSNYNVLAVESNSYHAVLGNIRGEVVWFEFDSEQRSIRTIGQRKIADHKLLNLFVVTHNDQRELVACGPEGEVIVSSLNESNWTESRPVKFELPACKYRQVNCVLKLSDHVIAFGDRSGNVIVCRSESVAAGGLETEETESKLKRELGTEPGSEPPGEPASESRTEPTRRFVLIKLFKKVHSLVGGCKQLIRHPFQSKFYSCGRDGRILEYDFDERSPDDQMVDLLRSIKPSIEMDAISRIEFDRSAGGRSAGDPTYVIGFRQNMFVVWNNRSQSIVWTVPASCSTKPWHFTISSDRLNFVYLKRDRLIYAGKRLDEASLLRRKYHTSTVLCAQPLFLKRRSDEGKKQYFLTGCEDSELFVNSFDPITNQTKVEATLHGHISNVRTCVVEDLLDHEENEDHVSSDSFTSSDHSASSDSLTSTNLIGHCLVITAGSASNLMVWQLRLYSGGQLKVKQLVNYFVWGSDRDTMNLPWIKKPKQQLDSQLRFMDVTLRRLPGRSNYLLSTVCSDATLRLFALSPAREFIHLLSTYSLFSYCPLKLLDLGLSRDCTSICTAHKPFSLITSTDGSLRMVEFDLESLALRASELTQNFPSNPLGVCVNDSEESELDLKQLDLDRKHPVRLVNDAIQAHRFGINSIDSVEIEPNKVLVFTAGEDTSIGYTLFAFEDEKLIESEAGTIEGQAETIEKTSGQRGRSVKVLLQGSYPSKHCSMVSKVKILGGDLLLTASWDQRIKIWQFTLTDDRVELVWLRTIVSSIPDISEVIVFPMTDQSEGRSDPGEITLGEITLIAVGEGEEIFKVDLSDRS